MERDLFHREDLRNMMIGLAQPAERLPLSVEMYRVGYLCALYDLARSMGISRTPPQLRCPMPELPDLWRGNG